VLSAGENPGSREAWSLSARDWGSGMGNLNVQLHKRSSDPVKCDLGYCRGKWRAKTLATLLKGEVRDFHLTQYTSTISFPGAWRRDFSAGGCQRTHASHAEGHAETNLAHALRMGKAEIDVSSASDCDVADTWIQVAKCCKGVAGVGSPDVSGYLLIIYAQSLPSCPKETPSWASNVSMFVTKHSRVNQSVFCCSPNTSPLSPLCTFSREDGWAFAKCTAVPWSQTCDLLR
jgi:hypothetical protein